MKVSVSIIGIILMMSISVIPSYAITFQEKSLESDSVKITFGKDNVDYMGNITPTLGC